MQVPGSTYAAPTRDGSRRSPHSQSPSRSELGDLESAALRRSGPVRAIAMSPLRSCAASSQDYGSDRADRGNRTREFGRSRTSGRSCADASIRGDAGARGRDQSDSQRMALVARRGSGTTASVAASVRRQSRSRALCASSARLLCSSISIAVGGRLARAFTPRRSPGWREGTSAFRARVQRRPPETWKRSPGRAGRADTTALACASRSGM